MEYLLGSEHAPAVRDVVRAPEASLHIPSLCDVDVASSIRRLLLRGLLSEKRAEEALRDYVDLPLIRHGHLQLLAQMLVLRRNFSAYDATYVALAGRLGARLVTGDQKLARAAGRHLDAAVVLV